jgi:hypothetical protein
MVIRQLYVVPPAKVGALGMTATERGLLAILLIATIAIGVVPEPLFALVRGAVGPLFG